MWRTSMLRSTNFAALRTTSDESQQIKVCTHHVIVFGHFSGELGLPDLSLILEWWLLQYDHINKLRFILQNGEGEFGGTVLCSSAKKCNVEPCKKRSVARWTRWNLALVPTFDYRERHVTASQPVSGGACIWSYDNNECWLTLFWDAWVGNFLNAIHMCVYTCMYGNNVSWCSDLSDLMNL